MSDVIQWAALVGMVAIAALFLIEVRRWSAADAMIGRRQRMLRIWLVVLIEALFVMMIIGPSFTSRKDPVSALIYWTVCVTVALAVVVVTLFDLREVAKGYTRASRRIFRGLRGEDDDINGAP